MAAVDEHLQDEEERIAQELGDDEQPADAGVDEEPTGDETEPEAAAGDTGGDDELDDDQAGDDEVDDEQAAAGDVNAEETMRKLNTKADGYIKGMIKLLGPELGGYAVCAECDPFLPGLMIPQGITDELRDAVRRQLGFDTLDELNADEEHFVQCTVCSGHGRVKTGSHKHGEQAKDCIACSGFGFRRIGTTQAVTPAAPAPDPAANVVDLMPPLAEGAPTELPPYDVFGTPSWHEDYGKMADMRKVPVSHWASNVQPPT